MTNYLTLGIVVLLLGYGCVEAFPLVAGPTLAITSPTHNAPFPSGIVSIRGKAARAAELTLDGTPVLREENGDFSSTLTFPHGGSLLTFVATDRFGRSVTVTRNVFVPDFENYKL
jgi:hypothetical protein